MKKLIVSFFVFLFLFILGASPTWSFDYHIGTDIHAVPHPIPPKPARGVNYTDPTFGTTIVRLTDAATDDGATSRYIINTYAKNNVENAGGTRALLAATNKGAVLYNVDKTSPRKYTYVKRALASPFYGNGFGVVEPRWDATDPNKFYFVSGMKFYSYTVVGDSEGSDYTTLIRDFSSNFPSATRIGTDEEGSPSLNSRYWTWTVFEGDTKVQAFTYDKDSSTPDPGKNGKILGQLSKSAYASVCSPVGQCNWCGTSVDGTKAILAGSKDATHAGYVSYNINFTGMVDLNGWNQHSDVGRDVNGNNIAVGIDAFYYSGGGCAQRYSFSDLNTGLNQCISARPFPDRNASVYSYGHISAGNQALSTPGWALYSSYGCAFCNGDCTCGGTGQVSADCQLIALMEIKHADSCASSPYTGHSRIWQVAHHNSGYQYLAMPMAVMNRTGTRIYFKSNWAWPATEADCTTTHPCETYIIELPENWYQDLPKSPDSPNAPIKLEIFKSTQ